MQQSFLCWSVAAQGGAISDGMGQPLALQKISYWTLKCSMRSYLQKMVHRDIYLVAPVQFFSLQTVLQLANIGERPREVDWGNHIANPVRSCPELFTPDRSACDWGYHVRHINMVLSFPEFPDVGEVRVGNGLHVRGMICNVDVQPTSKHRVFFQFSVQCMDLLHISRYCDTSGTIDTSNCESWIREPLCKSVYVALYLSIQCWQRLPNYLSLTRLNR